MAKGGKGTNHSIHPKGMSSHAPSVNDASRVLPKGPTVNDGATRDGVAVGDSERGPDKGVLK